MFSKTILVAMSALALFVSGCTTTAPTTKSSAERRQTIDANAERELAQLYAQVPGSRELVSKARGVLVFPGVISAGFVVGGSYGEGSLREGGRNSDYYSTAAVSAGLLIGADSKAIFVLFMTQESLNQFRASNGWTAGADASVTMVTMGASVNIDTLTARGPVIGFVLSNGGLMANLSLDGTKVTRLNL